jgi:energy-converting hydrogenase Eha subunit A
MLKAPSLSVARLLPLLSLDAPIRNQWGGSGVFPGCVGCGVLIGSILSVSGRD